MKLLVISHTFPFPPNEGIKLPVYNLIKEFSKNHKVILVSFIKPEEKKYFDEIKKYCDKLVVVPHKTSKNIFFRGVSLVFSKKPYSVEQFFLKQMLNEIKNIISEKNVDFIFFDFLTTAIYKNFVQERIPSLLHYHDAMSMLFYRNGLLEKNLLKKIYWNNQYKKILNFEKSFDTMFDKITVVAQKDKDWLIEKAGIKSEKIDVIPNGVDIEYFNADYTDFKQITQIEEKYPSILFRGIMDFKPNIDGCLYFLKKIFPLIKKQIPEIKFYIVGQNPPKEIKSYASEEVIITGYVDDLREYIVKTTVNVCPMISGSGIKNKILESMAMSQPSVITPIAAEGIPELKDEENILIAETDQEFANKTVLLLKNKELRKRIGEKGRKIIEQNYTWDKIVQKFYNNFGEIMKQNETKKVTIIIPVYNEVKTIDEVLKKMLTLNLGIEKEIIVVDDGSTDGTREMLKEFKDERSGVRVIFHEKNQGKGMAIRTGIKNSTGDIIAIQDADLEYNPEEIKKLLKPIIDGKMYVVYGSRFLQKNPVLYKKYYLGNKVISWILSVLYNYKITDSYTCYKVIHKKVFEQIDLTSKKFEIEAELTCKILKNGHKILEVPISYNPRTLNQGKKIKFKDAIIGFWTIIKNKFL